MAKKVVAVNPSKRKKTMATRRRKTTRRKTTRRRRTRRKNPMSPTLMAVLGTVAGAAAGGGADIGLRYTSLSPYTRALILGGTGLVGGIGLSFLDPTLAAGVGGGMGAVAASEAILQATAPKTTEEASASAQLSAVQAELGRVQAELAGSPTYPALEQGDPNAETVYVDEVDLAYLPANS